MSGIQDAVRERLVRGRRASLRAETNHNREDRERVLHSMGHTPRGPQPASPRRLFRSSTEPDERPGTVAR